MPSPRIWYRATVQELLRTDPVQIVGTLAQRAPAGIEREERAAWNDEIRILKPALDGMDGEILLEYPIPLSSRMCTTSGIRA